jgi:anti-sigma B factor antagonist
MNRGVMTLPQPNIYRHDRGRRALITLADEIDPATAPGARRSGAVPA